MPRLLLVDDNPSIHKIAETLLAPTSIELVCVESGPEAIARIQAGEAFDVALVDAAMAGMDGWELLAWMRSNASTAGIPIALMAGVLDAVDPLKLEQAPIQGFLKKPVELRDLGDRVRRLLETPVPPPPVPQPEPAPESPLAAQGLSPFATLPAVKLKDLPEFRAHASQVPAAEPVPMPAPVQAPEFDESDLLDLGEEDLLPEENPELPVAEDLQLEVMETEAVSLEEEPLDLEELDLDGLKGLNLEGAPEEPSLTGFEEVGNFPQVEPEVPVDLPDTGVLADTPGDPGDALTVSPEDLPDLGAETAVSVDEFPATPSSEASLDFDWADESESLLPPPVAEAEALAIPEPDEPGALLVPAVPVVAEDLAHSEPTLNLPPEPVIPVPAPTPLEAVPAAPMAMDASALVEALKADPVAMRILAKALLAELGENTLKEIAWELMPELAERLSRH